MSQICCLPILCGVIQCSVLGSLLFILCTTPLSSITQSHNLYHHFYEDDTQIYISLATPNNGYPYISSGIASKTFPFRRNNSKRKLNASKTEVLIISTPAQLRQLDGFFPKHVLSQSSTPAASVLRLGVTFIENVNFKQHYIENLSMLFLTISKIY